MKTLKFILPVMAFLFVMDGVTAVKEVPSIMKDGTVQEQCETGTLIVPPSGCGTTDRGKGRCQVLINSSSVDAFDSDDQSCEQPLYVQ